MDIDNLINDIDKLIEVSRFFNYDSEETYKKYIKELRKMKKHLKDGKIHKVFKGGSEDLDDS